MGTPNAPPAPPPQPPITGILHLTIWDTEAAPDTPPEWPESADCDIDMVEISPGRWNGSFGGFLYDVYPNNEPISIQAYYAGLTPGFIATFSPPIPSAIPNQISDGITMGWFGGFATFQTITTFQQVNYVDAFCPCPDALCEQLPGNVVRTVRPADATNFKVKLTS